MSRSRNVLVVILWAQIAVVASGQTAEPGVTLNLQAPRSETRKQLLHYTPIGSKLTDVKKFVSGQLARSGDNAVKVETPSSPNFADTSGNLRAKKLIKIYLGQYYDEPGVIFLTAPMISQKEVSAIWLFDDHDRLIDIIVTKKSAVY